MSEITFSLAIPHCSWIPDRVVSFSRLIAQLDGVEFEGDRIFAEKAANHVWSREMWSWAAHQSATHFLQLQDDVELCPDFIDALRACVSAYPNEIIGLEAADPFIKLLANEGRRWATTSDGLVGPGYVIPTRVLPELLAWVDALKPGASESIGEDTLIGLFCLHTGRRVYHPIPTLIDHDTTIASTYGNDSHPNRRPAVTWKDEPEVQLDSDVAWKRGSLRHIGRMYEATPRLLASILPAVPLASEVAKWVADDGLTERKRLTYIAKANAVDTNQAKILICTPHRGGLSAGYCASVWRLLHLDGVSFDLPYEMHDVRLADTDVVRVRSRFVEYFLRQTTCTHLLFIDADISFDPRAVLGMLRSGHDYVAAPYPKRVGVNFERVRRTPFEIPAEAVAYKYNLHAPDGIQLSGDCAPVDGVGLGFTLLSRECLSKMREAYASELSFKDEAPSGEVVDTVALFDLMRSPTGSLLSEDYSFCYRWGQIGGKVQLYLGQGSPVSHQGEHMYVGELQAFGMKRVPA